MAILQFSDGKTLSNLSDIVAELAFLNICLKQFDSGISPLVSDLLAQDLLGETARQQILELHDSPVECVKEEGDYSWSDVLSLHPGSPTLYSLMTTYSRYHTHSAPESLYILAGEAIFGFTQPDGTQLQLLVQPQDYIRIPADTEHWFSLSASLQVKAVRYFTTIEGWVPQYTGTIMSDFLEKLR
jgi:1,2-dihydroxy-3-keto-5-methylthiopentene dioxygenase